MYFYYLNKLNKFLGIIINFVSTCHLITNPIYIKVYMNVADPYYLKQIK